MLPPAPLLLPWWLIVAMVGGWSSTWRDILNGGNPRWKIDDLAHKQAALKNIVQSSGNKQGGEELSILCPLAGDDPFVVNAWKQGHRVTAIDLVPEAVEAMKARFGSSMTEWKRYDYNPSESSMSAAIFVKWTSLDDKVPLYQSDMLKPISHLLETEAKFDAVYDKDSFGALEKHMRPAYSQRISEYTKPGSVLYLEVKNRENGDKSVGPPFHVTKEDLEEHFDSFEYDCYLGEVYKLPIPGMQQMGHIMKRK